MFKRTFFWLGLLLGGFASFGSLRKTKTQTSSFPELQLLDDLIGDALIVCDAAGRVCYLNTAAKTLFGPVETGDVRLGYPTGQAVPPGQHPLRCALRSGRKVEGTNYLYRDAAGMTRTFDVSARPLPGAGAAILFHDLTGISAIEALQYEISTRNRIVQRLGWRLNKTTTLEEIATAVVEQTKELFLYPVEAQIRLYTYSAEAQTLTRLAAFPVDRPKRPKTAAQAQPPVFLFDAQNEAIWQLYLLRRPSDAGLTILGEPEAAAAYALPLVAGGVAVGHLGLSSSTGGAFRDPILRETLKVFASLAGLALAIPQSVERAVALQTQADAIREITHAVAAGMDADRLADRVMGHVRRITGAEVCALSLDTEGKLAVVGAFQDDLLLPERTAPNAPALHGKAVQKAWRTQKTVAQLGIANPSYEAGPWRVFAGRSGQHSVVAVPLVSRRGVLTVYTDGSAPMPPAQITFLETVAALVSLGLGQASVPEAAAG